MMSDSVSVDVRPGRRKARDTEEKWTAAFIPVTVVVSAVIVWAMEFCAGLLGAVWADTVGLVRHCILYIVRSG